VIGYGELKAIAESAPRGYPDRERLEEWWAERGVDHDGLERFCMEDAADSVENALPTMAGAGVDDRLAAVLSAGYAMSTEIGFVLGWIAHERSRS
jgi:hypothetical protein